MFTGHKTFLYVYKNLYQIQIIYTALLSNKDYKLLITMLIFNSFTYSAFCFILKIQCIIFSQFLEA